MKGKVYGKDCQDPAGFHPGKEFFVEFTPRKALKVFSEDGKVDLVSNEPCDEKKPIFSTSISTTDRKPVRSRWLAELVMKQR